MTTSAATVSYATYDELKRDRDFWKKQAVHLKLKAEDLEIDNADLRRQIKHLMDHGVIFGGRG